MTQPHQRARTAEEDTAVLCSVNYRRAAAMRCHTGCVGYRDDQESDVRRLLNELCIKLGFCLPPDDVRRLEEAPPGEVDDFTDAVFKAEGMGDMSYTDLRREVRAVVDRHMSRWK